MMLKNVSLYWVLFFTRSHHVQAFGHDSWVDNHCDQSRVCVCVCVELRDANYKIQTKKKCPLLTACIGIFNVMESFDISVVL